LLSSKDGLYDEKKSKVSTISALIWRRYNYFL